jgi:hypothetical protein
MAYRRTKSARGRATKSSRSRVSRRSYRSPARKTTRRARPAAKRRASPAKARTIRIVIEQPSVSAVSRPEMLVPKTEAPKKAKF